MRSLPLFLGCIVAIVSICNGFSCRSGTSSNKELANLIVAIAKSDPKLLKTAVASADPKLLRVALACSDPKLLLVALVQAEPELLEVALTEATNINLEVALTESEPENLRTALTKSKPDLLATALLHAQDDLLATALQVAHPDFLELALTEATRENLRVALQDATQENLEVALTPAGSSFGNYKFKSRRFQDSYRPQKDFGRLNDFRSNSDRRLSNILPKIDIGRAGNIRPNTDIDGADISISQGNIEATDSIRFGDNIGQQVNVGTTTNSGSKETEEVIQLLVALLSGKSQGVGNLPLTTDGGLDRALLPGSDVVVVEAIGDLEVTDFFGETIGAGRSNTGHDQVGTNDFDLPRNPAFNPNSGSDINPVININGSPNPTNLDIDGNNGNIPSLNAGLNFNGNNGNAPSFTPHLGGNIGNTPSLNPRLNIAGNNGNTPSLNSNLNIAGNLANIPSLPSNIEGNLNIDPVTPSLNIKGNSEFDTSVALLLNNPARNPVVTTNINIAGNPSDSRRVFDTIRSNIIQAQRGGQGGIGQSTNRNAIPSAARQSSIPGRNSNSNGGFGNPRLNGSRRPVGNIGQGAVQNRNNVGTTPLIRSQFNGRAGPRPLSQGLRGSYITFDNLNIGLG